MDRICKKVPLSDTRQHGGAAPSRLLFCYSEARMALRVIVTLVILISFAVILDAYLYDGYYRLVAWQEFKLAARVAHVELHRLAGIIPLGRPAP